MCFRYIGSKREIANFENFRTMGPIVNVQPVGTGTGAVIAIVTDPNYEVRFPTKERKKFLYWTYRLGIDKPIY